MFMRSLIHGAFLSIGAICISAQCPRVTVSGPNSVLPEGRAARFSAVLYGGDLKTDETYQWAVSSGSIVSGQGTSVISVDTKGAAGKIITATLNVGGLAANCNGKVTGTAEVMGTAAPVAAPITTPLVAPKPPITPKKPVKRKRP